MALEPRERSLHSLPLSIEGFPFDSLHRGTPLLHQPFVRLVELDDRLCPVLPLEKAEEPLTRVTSVGHQVGWMKLGVGATSFKQWGIVQAVKNSLEFLNNGRCLPNLGGDGKLGVCHRKAHTFLWSGATGALYACGPVLFRTIVLRILSVVKPLLSFFTTTLSRMLDGVRNSYIKAVGIGKSLTTKWRHSSGFAAGKTKGPKCVGFTALAFSPFADDATARRLGTLATLVYAGPIISASLDTELCNPRNRGPAFIRRQFRMTLQRRAHVAQTPNISKIHSMLYLQA